MHRIHESATIFGVKSVCSELLRTRLHQMRSVELFILDHMGSHESGLPTHFGRGYFCNPLPRGEKMPIINVASLQPRRF